jgi:hypothetical protein
VIARASVSLIIRTGGADPPFRQDLHFNEASSFQIRVSRGRRIASSGRLARYLQKSLNRSGDSSVALVDADLWVIGRAQLRNQRQHIGRLLDQL